MHSTIRLTLAALVAAVTAVQPAFSGERERRIVIPATDFSRAETYEAMQGGAATSRKAPNADAESIINGICDRAHIFSSSA